MLHCQCFHIEKDKLRRTDSLNTGKQRVALWSICDPGWQAEAQSEHLLSPTTLSTLCVYYVKAAKVVTLVNDEHLKIRDSIKSGCYCLFNRMS